MRYIIFILLFYSLQANSQMFMHGSAAAKNKTDPLAQRYYDSLVANGMTYDTAILYRTWQLVRELKGYAAFDTETQAGFDKREKLIYPFEGGTLSTASFNLVNTSIGKITWNGTITVDSVGVDGDATTGYGNTNTSPISLDISNVANAITIYSTENITSGNKIDIGAVAYEGGNNFLSLGFIGNGRYSLNSTVRSTPAISNTIGLWTANRNSYSNPILIKGSILQAQAAQTLGYRDTGRIFILAGSSHPNNAAFGFSDRKLAFASFGTGFDTDGDSVYVRQNTIRRYLKRKGINNYKSVAADAVVVEQFGAGGGNDWCFVRTPSNYTTTGQPHKMVILSHGNGWVMNGTLNFANFSGRNQYGVDTSNGGAYLSSGGDPNYLLYSSPLIEALLDSGYVVCGAQNFGDALYGNDDCRNAAVQFYNYMLYNYNVQDRCYIMGASNGAMTSLNAIRLLGKKRVAGFIGFYPLANLVGQYFDYAPHQAGIQSAYGTGSFADTATMIANGSINGHCPVHYDYAAYLPPMLLIGSGGDTVTDYTVNSVALFNYATANGVAVTLKDIDPNGVNGYEHGDWRHFNLTWVFDFLRAYK